MKQLSHFFKRVNDLIEEYIAILLLVMICLLIASTYFAYAELNEYLKCAYVGHGGGFGGGGAGSNF